MVNDNITFYAFRYALGRKTYAVQHVVDYLVENWNLLKGSTQEHIEREIIEAFDENKIGMEMDKREWQRVLNLAQRKGIR